MFSLVAEAIIVSCLQTNLQPGSLLHTADYISSSVFLFHRNFAGGYGGYPSIYIHLSTQQLVSRVPIMHLLLHKFGVGCHTSPTKIIQTSLSVTQRIHTILLREEVGTVCVTVSVHYIERTFWTWYPNLDTTAPSLCICPVKVIG